MKRIVSLLFAFLVFAYFLPAKPSAEIGVSASACVLIDADTKAVLFKKNADKKMPMASTTKIMTALLCLENEDKNEEFTVDSKAIRVEGSSMGLIEGDRVTLKTLAVGMLMLSGNDAANAAAVKMAGSTESFAALMNKRAEAIGMKNTSFETPSGLDSKNHYSTAYDMALLGAEAIKNSEFLSICSKSKYSVTFGKTPQKRTFYNHNRLLKTLDGCIGIKTGFTKKSGRCLVSAVRRNGRTLVCVTLNAPNDWQDHKNLYDFGFSLYKKEKIDLKLPPLYIVNSQKTKIAPALFNSCEVYKREGEKINVRILMRPFEYAPVYEGDVVGSVAIEANGTEIFESELVASESAHAKNEYTQSRKLTPFERLVEWIKGLFK